MSAVDPAQLTEMEREALLEIVSIGTGRSAETLRRSHGVPVDLVVPSVDIVGPETARDLVGREGGELLIVRRRFEGACAGRAKLIVPAEGASALAHAFTGHDPSADEVATSVTETGRVILGECLQTMSGMLDGTLAIAEPEFEPAGRTSVFTEVAGAIVMFLHANLTVRGRNVQGYVAVLMDMASHATLRRLVDGFIRDVLGESNASPAH